jgi:septal ring factor EnvC (AmiA/AmiB activator)
MQILHSYRFILSLSVWLSVSIMSVNAQSVQELERQRKLTLQRLETTSKILTETKNSQKNSLTKLNIIKKSIDQRKSLINNISKEINALDLEMQKLNNQKLQLTNKLNALKIDYAKLVQEAHINKSTYSKMMFILSAESFDQSYRRLRYLQEYTNYRKEQVREIEKTKAEIEEKNEKIAQNKTVKVEIVKQKETEAKVLSKDENKQKGVLSSLQKKEKKLRADLKVQQRRANELNNKIAYLIAEEIRKAEAKRAAEQAKKDAADGKSTADKDSRTTAQEKTTSTSVSTLTKEEKLISGGFQNNKGRLPWPTSHGFISGHFGVQNHPVLAYVTTNNKGIYIQTPTNGTARAVFEGVVTQRFSIPGSNNAVIIKHGNYRTVYANLTQIYVNVGDKVTAKQSLGKIYTDDDDDNKTELYFQI